MTPFEAHIQATAWYQVLSEVAKESAEGASQFAMAKMAASEGWVAGIEEAAKRIYPTNPPEDWTEDAEARAAAAAEIRALAKEQS